MKRNNKPGVSPAHLVPVALREGCNTFESDSQQHSHAGGVPVGDTSENVCRTQRIVLNWIAGTDCSKVAIQLRRGHHRSIEIVLGLGAELDGVTIAQAPGSSPIPIPAARRRPQGDRGRVMDWSSGRPSVVWN